MKRFTSYYRRYGLNSLFVFLPVVVVSCMSQSGLCQSSPKLQLPNSVDLFEVPNSYVQDQDLPPILEPPEQSNRERGSTGVPEAEFDADIELFTSQGESVMIKPMAPEELQSTPRQVPPSKPESAEVIVVEPDQPWLPDIERADSEFDGPKPELPRYRPATPRVCPQKLRRPRLGIAGELVCGWGFRVSAVIPGSAAARMQLERGDVILNINGRCVSSIGTIEQQLLWSAGELNGWGIIKIDNVRGRTRCGASSKRFLWLKFQL